MHNSWTNILWYAIENNELENIAFMINQENKLQKPKENAHEYFPYLDSKKFKYI